MIEKITQLHPEIALFTTVCIVMVMGLSRSSFWRAACAWVTGLGLIVSLVLSLRSPATDGLLPQFLPYTKTLIAAVGLLVLPLMGGTVDRWYERQVGRG